MQIYIFGGEGEKAFSLSSCTGSICRIQAETDVLFVFAENAVEDDACREGKDRPSTDSADNDHYCKSFGRDLAQIQDESKDSQKDKGIREIPKRHKCGIFNCLPGSADKM